MAKGKKQDKKTANKIAKRSTQQAQVTRSRSRPLGILLAGGCLLLAVYIQYASPIQPYPSFAIDPVEIPAPEEDDPLRHAEHLLLNELLAPEDGFRLDEDGDDWIWSLGNGDLVQANMKTQKWTKLAKTGEEHADCGQLPMEEHCGRPLGLFKLPPGDVELYMKYVPEKYQQEEGGQKPLFLVADAYKGLLLVLSKGAIITLLTTVEGKPLHFANSMARAQNGTIYLSDTSSKFRRNQVLLEVLESQPLGRVVAWDPITGSSLVVVDQIPFSNGLVLQDDDKQLLISSTTRHQILQLDMTNSKPKPEVFAKLPGTPDNLHVEYIPEWKRSVLWVGLATKATVITKILNSSPQLRKALSTLNMKALMKCFKKYGLLVALDADTGKILHSYQDPTGRTAYIAGIHFDDEYGYIGSWKNPFLARIAREKLFNVKLEA